MIWLEIRGKKIYNTKGEQDNSIQDYDMLKEKKSPNIKKKLEHVWIRDLFASQELGQLSVLFIILQCVLRIGKPFNCFVTEGQVHA